jgi:DNA mismatch repair protein MutL
VLPEELASQIAAGEVVERPASVVKELVENALDAGSRRVDVQVRRGGKQALRVVDDGCGMTAAELELALQRHATSKLRTLEDLGAISTLGFRGEALPSVASVSRLSVTSRPADEVVGLRCEATPGAPPVLREVGSPAGTAVEVSDLFFNVPARLKFLKTDRTESAHVAETVLQLALAYPSIHVTLTEDGRRSLDLPRHGSLLERVRAALGRRGSGALHPVAFQQAGLQVDGVIGAPESAVASAKNVYLLVNGRAVRDRLLLRMLAGGYGELLERGRYPVAVLHLRLPDAVVDVNVHPQKLEVRFADPQRVASLVRRAVSEGIASAPWSEAAGVGAGRASSAARTYPLRSAPRSAPRVGDAAAGADGSGPGSGPRGVPGRVSVHPGALAERWAPYGVPPQRQEGAEGPAMSRATRGGEQRATAGSEAAAPPPPGSLRHHRYLGQFLRTYLLFEGDGELVLLDQHAAHERVTYGRLREALAQGAVKMQRLLFPAQLRLTPAEAAVLDERGEVLGRCGLDVEPLGGQTAVVRGVPALLADGDPERMVRDVLHELMEGPAAASVERALELAVATMACHASVRAGQWLGEAEVAALLEALEGVERSGHCPHGRPVVVRLGEAEIRRRFRRE